MTNILKLTLNDVSTLGADESVVLKTDEIIFTNDYPLHSREREHLRQLANLHVASLRKKSEQEIEPPLHHFLYYGDNGKVRLSPIKYKFWLERHNFAKFFPVDSKTYTFIKIDGKLIEETNEKWIKEYVTNELKSSAIGGDYSFFDFMASNEKYFDAKFLSILESSKVEFQQDTKDTCYLYYQNCIVKVTADKVEEIDYNDVENYVWKNQVIPRDFVKTDHKECEFRQFLYCASGQNMTRYKTVQSAVGYLLHSYKNKAKNKAIILNDAIISDNPDGGSGKGLFCIGISHIKKVDGLNGKKLDSNKAFDKQTVRMDCQVLVYEDVKKNFDFEDMFSDITEGLTIEYKNQPAVKLPVEKSPKMVITTNYTIGGIGGSHERRKFEIEFTDFFKHKYSPYDHFGRMMFDDWTTQDWNEFDNYMIKCLMVFLKHGLIECDFDNIDVKKFIRSVGTEFYEWTKNHDFIEYGVRVKKSELWNSFFEDYPDSKKYYHERKQVACLEAYAKYYDYVYSFGNTKGFGGIGRWVMLQKKDTDGNTENINVPFFDPNEPMF